jgi:hypothetical protein
MQRGIRASGTAERFRHHRRHHETFDCVQIGRASFAPVIERAGL